MDLVKSYLILFCLPIFFCFTACDKSNDCIITPSIQSGICIDSALINDSIYCIEIYDPVCGCDGITYGNSCKADRFGVTSYVAGECCD